MTASANNSTQLKDNSQARFDRLLAESAAAHGHLCPGQVVGVRMALLGLRLCGIPEPVSDIDIKKLLVYVEMDRCAGDAVAFVSRVKLGRRSLKFIDSGIMAATFLNLETGRAFRVVSTEESRDLAQAYAPGVADLRNRQLAAYKAMPDSVLFRAEEVEVEPSPYDLPGPTRKKVTCDRCGQVVRDDRQWLVEGRPLCRHCAGQGYFKNPRPLGAEQLDGRSNTVPPRQAEVRSFPVIRPSEG